MADSKLSVRFWGVRGSYPVPGPATAHYGGNTSCVEVRAGRHTVILDAGTGLIGLGRKLGQEFAARGGQRHIVNLILSHTHHDHVQGLPYFAPAFRHDCTINIFGQKTMSEGMADIFSGYMAPQYSPIELCELNADLCFHDITHNQALVFPADSGEPEPTRRHDLGKLAPGAALLTLMRNYAHPKIGTFVIKIEIDGKSVVYATDKEGYIGGDTRLAQFADGANLLIHDAQYTPAEYLKTQGFGHSTYEMATDVARAARVENLVLFHHDPAHGDDELADLEKQAQKLFAKTVVGREGLEFEF